MNVAATDSTTPTALLDGYQAALTVPLATALLAVTVGAFGLRGRSRAKPAPPTATVASASDRVETPVNP